MSDTLRLTITQTDYMQLMSYAAEYKDTDSRVQLLYDILDDKIDRILERELYSKSKTAPTQEEREAAKKEYWERRRLKF